MFDLYEFFWLVVLKGGLVEVINKKLWWEIIKGFNFFLFIISVVFIFRI